MLLYSALKSFSNNSVSDVFLVLYTQRQKIILSFGQRRQILSVLKIRKTKNISYSAYTRLLGLRGLKKIVRKKRFNQLIYEKNLNYF